MGVDVVTDPRRPELGEFRRETGFGRVSDVKPKGDRNVSVEITTEHLRHPVRAWVDSHNAAVHVPARQSFAEGRRIRYTIEVVRKHKGAAAVDPAIPLAELDKSLLIRDLAECVLVDGDGMPVGDSPAPPPVRDRPSPPAQPAQEPRNGDEAPDPAPGPPAAAGASTGPGKCPRCQLDIAGLPVVRNPGGESGGFVHRTCPQPPPEDRPGTTAEPQAGETFQCPLCDAFAYPTQADLDEHLTTEHRVSRGMPPAPPAGPAPSARGRRGGPRIAEPKPWELHDEYGNLNLGSYAVAATLATVELAYELVVERNRTQAVAEGRAMVEPSLPQVKALAKCLLEAADQAQATVRTDGRTDRMDNSHRRARGAVRVALDLYPVPWGAEPADRNAWVETLARHASAMLGLAVALMEES